MPNTYAFPVYKQSRGSGETSPIYPYHVLLIRTRYIFQESGDIGKKMSEPLPRECTDTTYSKEAELLTGSLKSIEIVLASPAVDMLDCISYWV